MTNSKLKENCLKLSQIVSNCARCIFPSFTDLLFDSDLFFCCCLRETITHYTLSRGDSLHQLIHILRYHGAAWVVNVRFSKLNNGFKKLPGEYLTSRKLLHLLWMSYFNDKGTVRDFWGSIPNPQPFPLGASSLICTALLWMSYLNQKLFD